MKVWTEEERVIRREEAARYRARLRTGLNTTGDPRRKLTSIQVGEARQLSRDGVSTGELANRYGITRQAMARAIRGVTYKRVYDSSDHEFMTAVRDGLTLARDKHPGGDRFLALVGEFAEVCRAVEREGKDRVRSECVDLAITALRLATEMEGA